MATTTKMADISAASMNTRASLVNSAKARSLFFSLHCISVCEVLAYYWHNSESLEIKTVISGNSLLFEGIKISLGLLITV